MARLSLKATNLPSVAAAMRQFPRELDAELGKSLRSGMESLKAKAVWLAPKRDRHLARSIYTRVVKSGKGWSGTLGSNRVYARIREYGGIIRAKHARYLKFRTRDGRFVQVKQVTQRATPYMRPALRQTRADVLRELHKGGTRAAQTISRAAR